MAISISIGITQNSQSIANNTSNITVSVVAKWTGGSYNKLEKSGWLKIDGTTYNFTSPFNTGQTTSGSVTLYSKTVNVTHAANGTKTVSCSASYTSGVSSGTVTASASKALTTIPRKSTLAASNGELGTTLALTVTKQASSFTHTITYKCGTATGTICTKSSSTSVSWNTSNGNTVDLASQNTSGTSVSVTFTIETFNGSTSLGTNTKTVSMNIPARIKPTCSIAVSDAEGYASVYGGYIKGLSRFAVNVAATPAYSSPIKSYRATANGTTYTTASFTTEVIKTSGAVEITAAVTDNRGRSGSATPVAVTVIDYSAPKITELKTERRDTETTASGALAVVFSSSVTALSNKNSAAYTLKYKKSTEPDENYQTVQLTDFDNQYSVTNGEYVFEADASVTYDILFTVSDSFGDASKTATGSSAKKLFSIFKGGLGFAFGKIAELAGVLDIAFQTRFTGGILSPVLESQTDLNDIKTPNTYVGANTTTYQYANCPLDSGTFSLLVESGGEGGQVKQRLTRCHKTEARIFERWYYQSTWGDWIEITPFEVVLYDSATGTNSNVRLSEAFANFKYLEIYFTDNNALGTGYLKHYVPYGTQVDLYLIEPATSGGTYIRKTKYNLSNTYYLRPVNTNCGYSRIDGTTVSTVASENYIKVRRVIGIR